MYFWDRSGFGARWVYFMKFVNNIDDLEFICVELQMNRRCFWVMSSWSWTFWTFSSLFACACRQQQPVCLKPNCMFYFWKLPHVFVMSFDIFDVFCNKCKWNWKWVWDSWDEFTCREFTFYSWKLLLVERMHGLHRAAAFCKKEQLDKKKLNIACCMRTACDLLSFSCVEKRTECCSEIAWSFGVFVCTSNSRRGVGRPLANDASAI